VFLPDTNGAKSKIEFKAECAQPGSSVYFRFEKDAHPDTEPSFPTESIDLSTSLESYVIEIDPKSGKTYRSFLMYPSHQCTITNIKLFLVASQSLWPPPSSPPPPSSCLVDDQLIGAGPTVCATKTCSNKYHTMFYAPAGKITGVELNRTQIAEQFYIQVYAPIKVVQDLIENNVSDAVPITTSGPYLQWNQYFKSHYTVKHKLNGPIIQYAADLSVGFNSFGGATIDNDYYSRPISAESWAGFGINPIMAAQYFKHDENKITFTGSCSVETNIRFKFEKDAYPDVFPDHELPPVSVGSGDLKEYSVTFSKIVNKTLSDGTLISAPTFKSLIMYIEAGSTCQLQNIVIKRAVSAPYIQNYVNSQTEPTEYWQTANQYFFPVEFTLANDTDSMWFYNVGEPFLGDFTPVQAYWGNQRDVHTHYPNATTREEEHMKAKTADTPWQTSELFNWPAYEPGTEYETDTNIRMMLRSHHESFIPAVANVNAIITTHAAPVQPVSCCGGTILGDSSCCGTLPQ
jgi:hypothetical protein